MKVVIPVGFICPVCGIALLWIRSNPEQKQLVTSEAILEHPKMEGLEYCEYYGKRFKPPSFDLVELETET